MVSGATKFGAVVPLPWRAAAKSSLPKENLVPPMPRSTCSLLPGAAAPCRRLSQGRLAGALVISAMLGARASTPWPELGPSVTLGQGPGLRDMPAAKTHHYHAAHWRRRERGAPCGAVRCCCHGMLGTTYHGHKDVRYIAATETRPSPSMPTQRPPRRGDVGMDGLGARRRRTVAHWLDYVRTS